MNNSRRSSSGQFVQHRLYTINRSGSGEAFYILLTPDHNDVLTYQIKTEHWKATKDISHFGVAIVNNFLYIIGGFNVATAKHVKRVVRFDPDDGTWKDVKPLPIARAKFATAVLDGKILILGGEESNGKVLSSCEMYDPEQNEWTEAPPLVSPRANHMCVVHHNEIYCAGGYYGNKSHRNIWTYEGRRWEDLGRPYPHQLPESLDRFAMTTVGRHLYFIGGVVCTMDNQEKKLKFVTHRRIFSYTTSVSAMSRPEVVEEEEDDTDDEKPVLVSEFISPWNLALPNMSYGRHSHGVATVGTRIFVMGGSLLETGQQVRIVEVFDTEKGEWEEDFRFRKGDVSNVTCAILEVPYKQEETRVNERLKWILW
ncbi:kelch-like protein 13 [Saccostrea echinata]|uniref:kelch-like protein 13 n=1 Tax=Saccostrea echinata TaxID=191078 RepID=UPI002A83C404|nr:kelch-like protein 13 [Saccostrea echinata]XP_061165248.1 kelch-like protein 13 [Saccostrea echinata]